MRAYWNNLNDRERWVLALGATFCFLYLFYLLVYGPLTHAIHDKSQQLTEKQETLTWMQLVRGEHKKTKAPQVLSNSQLLSLLANQLQSTSFQQFTYELQQTGTGDIQLSFDQVPFNPFMKWLSSINSQYAVTVKQFNAERTELSGVVKLKVVMAAK